MTTYFLKQFVSLCLTLIVAAILVFSMVRLIPGDPVIAAIGEENYTPEIYEATEARLGLDQPFILQLGDYLVRLATFDFGTSFQTNRPVIDNIADQLPYTIYLATFSFIFSILIAFPAGVISALYRNTWFDQMIMMFALSALCTPSFFLGLLAIIFFSGQLGWFPSFGTGTADNPWSIIQHVLLPALVLGASTAGLLARLIRSSLVEVLSQEYVRTARSKGLAERIVILRHALPNAVIPVITILGMDLARLLTGTVVIETLFSRLGVGKTLIDAILFRDYPQVQGTLLLFISIVIIANTLTDVTYTILDPRITIE